MIPFPSILVNLHLQTNQILIASNMVGVVEGLLYAKKAGLNLDDVIAAVGAGAAGSYKSWWWR